MSVILLSAKHFNSVYQFMKQDIHDKRGDMPEYVGIRYNRVFLEAFCTDLGSIVTGAMDFIDSVAKLNTDTWNKKYKRNDEIPDWIGADKIVLDRKDFYQALCCIRYQIEEWYLDNDYITNITLDVLSSLIHMTGDVIFLKSNETKSELWSI